ncbi:MAG: hypothetical protein A2033_02715 [Bacteroidetes bacterium GWA2_31_9]|nr:MAG: hypothetical protein A2033_02715 [Bacteroidetes bacterium GWA2_31_9]
MQNSQISNNRFYLLGFMGSGKSTVGKRLANKLGFNFIDLDNYIEKKHFKTVAKIFETESEQSFRLYEKACLEEVSQFENVIISCGGGTPCFFNNMELMNETGRTIYLKLSPLMLVSRLRNSKKINTRPLIMHKSKEELTEYVENTLNVREECYLKSKIIVDAKNKNISEIIDLIKISDTDSQ